MDGSTVGGCSTAVTPPRLAVMRALRRRVGRLAGLVERGLDGPLLFFDVCGGGALWLALWGRRRWPFGLGLASVPVLAFSASAGPAGAIILFTVAAYRRWQLAVLIAGLQLAVLP